MRILIIGGGSIGERHLKNLKAQGIECEVCDLRKERLLEIEKRHGVIPQVQKLCFNAFFFFYFICKRISIGKQD